MQTSAWLWRGPDLPSHSGNGSHKGYFTKGGGVFPGGPGVKTPRLQCWGRGSIQGTGSIPGQGTKIPNYAWHGKKKKGFKKIKRGAGMGSEFDRELVMK